MKGKKRNKIQWGSSDIADGKTIPPPIAKNEKDLTGLHEAELFVGTSDEDPCIMTRTASGRVVRIGGGEGGESKNYWEILTDPSGMKYLFTDLPVVTSRYVTYGGGPNPYIKSMFEEIPIDGKTITWQEGQLVASGGGGGGLSKITVKVGTTPYESVEGVVSIPAYPTIPTNYVTTDTEQTIRADKWFGDNFKIDTFWGQPVIISLADNQVDRGLLIKSSTGIELAKFGFVVDRDILRYAYIGDNYADPWLKILSRGDTQTKRMFVDARLGTGTDISLAIGDNDTGFDWVDDGRVAIKSNNIQLASFGGTSFDFNVSMSLSDIDTYVKFRTPKTHWWVGVGIDSGDGKFVIYNATKGKHRFAMDDYHCYIYSDLVVTGYTTWGGGSGSGSDARYKTIIENIDIPLDQIADAPTIRYKWNKEGMDDKTHAGGTAQYMEEVIPETVHTGDDDFKSLDYATTAYLFAVQDARYIRELEKRVEALERKINQPNILKRIYEKITLFISAAFGGLRKGGRHGSI